MKRMRLLGLALLAFFLSCSDGLAPARRTADLDAALDRWRGQNLHTYAFTLQRACFCGNVHPLYVVVLSDTVAGVLDLETGAMVDRRLGQTVYDLFNFIRDAINRPAYRIDVEYDVAKGFPVEINYDGSTQIADDEIDYHVSDVHPITPRLETTIASRSSRLFAATSPPTAATR